MVEPILVQGRNIPENALITCAKCEVMGFMPFTYKEFGTYTAKIVKCQNCGHINIIQETEDEWLHTNEDPRLYRYRKKV